MHHLSLSEKVQAFCAESASSNPNSNLAASNVGAGVGRIPNNNGLIPTNTGKLQVLNSKILLIHLLVKGKNLWKKPLGYVSREDVFGLEFFSFQFNDLLFFLQ